MILSHKWRFIFIKGRKIAGTSVEIALSSVCGPEDIITPIFPVDELDRLNQGIGCQNFSTDRTLELKYLDRLRSQPDASRQNLIQPRSAFYNHMSLAELHAKVALDISGYSVISVERSPYSKIMSLIYFEINAKSYNRDGHLSNGQPLNRKSIEAYFADGAILKARNIDLYKNRNGQLGTNPMRYDKIIDDFADSMRHLGIASPPILPHAKKGLMFDTFNPAEYFTRDQLNTINTMFADEFRTFGYERI